MSFPRFNPSREAMLHSSLESRSGWLDDDSGQGFLEAPHPAATPRIPPIAANVDSRTPVADQEDFEQYFKNTPFETSATPQDHLSYDVAADTRRASDSSERTLMNGPRKKCNVLFKGYPSRLTSTQTRSHRPECALFWWPSSLIYETSIRPY
jgi:hypothetical protein